MASESVIVFGPTGGVASKAAQSAQQQGAKVFLAMRDTQKAIPGLSVDQEKQGGYERIKADLLDADSVKAAITQSGAKCAFFYLMFAAQDGMKSTVEALKTSGVERIVFLSSFSVQGEPYNLDPSDHVAYAHAQVEINLENAFGKENYIAVRPAYFATNSLRWKKMIASGEVKLAYPEVAFDWIAAEDIGNTCGKLLAHRPFKSSLSKDESFIYLCGPEQLAQKDAIEMIGKAIGKDVKVTGVDEKEGIRIWVEEQGIPKPIADYLMVGLRKRSTGEANVFNTAPYREGLANIRTQTGQDPTTFSDWLAQNKHEFTT